MPDFPALTYASIAAFRDTRQQETDVLEFKSGRLFSGLAKIADPAVQKERKKKVYADLRRDVVAMANGQGGQIVIGVDEDETTHRAAALSPITSTDCTKDQLTQVLSCEIDPPIALKFDEVDDPAGGRFFLVITVPVRTETSEVYLYTPEAPQIRDNATTRAITSRELRALYGSPRARYEVAIRLLARPPRDFREGNEPLFSFVLKNTGTRKIEHLDAIVMMPNRAKFPQMDGFAPSTFSLYAKKDGSGEVVGTNRACRLNGRPCHWLELNVRNYESGPILPHGQQFSRHVWLGFSPFPGRVVNPMAPPASQEMAERYALLLADDTVTEVTLKVQVDEEPPLVVKGTVEQLLSEAGLVLVSAGSSR